MKKNTHKKVKKKIKKKKIKKNTFAIGIPHMGTVRQETSSWLAKICMANPKIVQIIWRSQQPVDLNRNGIIHDFLKTDKEWLLFLDTDMIPRGNLIGMAKKGVKIVSGLTTVMQHGTPYPLIMKKAKNRQVCFKMIERSDLVNAKNNLIEVDGVGTGCLLIHRSVFKKVAPPWFKFNMGPDGMSRLSEDYYFSRKVKRAGYKLYVDIDQHVGHLKVVNLYEFNKLLAKVVMQKQRSINFIKGKINGVGK